MITFIRQRCFGHDVESSRSKQMIAALGIGAAAIALTEFRGAYAQGGRVDLLKKGLYVASLGLMANRSFFQNCLFSYLSGSLALTGATSSGSRTASTRGVSDSQIHQRLSEELDRLNLEDPPTNDCGRALYRTMAIQEVERCFGITIDRACLSGWDVAREQASRK